MEGHALDDACVSARVAPPKGMRFGAIILTGGASSRMGSDKAVLDWNGQRAVDRLAALADHVGAAACVTSGAHGYGLPFASEEPPGGGPVAGIVAAAKTLMSQGCRRALVLAVDAPTFVAADLAALLASAAPGACFEGQRLPLVLDLVSLPQDGGRDWPMIRLIEAIGLTRLPCPAGAESRLRGANTPAEHKALLEVLIAAEGARNRGAG
jgi:molybdopterin-guanine dinucleotide biosynthesis protein A